MVNMKSGMFSSLRGDWRTPKELYAELDKEFHFDFDPCPSNPDFDGLNIAWGQVNFVNPPYGRQIAAWISKAWTEWKMGKTVVLLVPSRTDTRWWHNYLMGGEIRFIQGRLHFDNMATPAPFPSAVVVFRGKNNGQPARQG